MKLSVFLRQNCRYRDQTNNLETRNRKLEENIKENLGGLRFGSEFPDPTSRAQAVKKKKKKKKINIYIYAGFFFVLSSSMI